MRRLCIQHSLRRLGADQVAARCVCSFAAARCCRLLQVEVILYCHKRWLDAIWFVRDLEQVQCSWKERAPNAHPAFGHTYQKLDLGRWPV